MQWLIIVPLPENYFRIGWEKQEGSSNFFKYYFVSEIPWSLVFGFLRSCLCWVYAWCTHSRGWQQLNCLKYQQESLCEHSHCFLVTCSLSGEVCAVQTLYSASCKEWSGILLCKQKTFRAELRKHHCSENLNWQPLFIVFFQGKLFFGLSEINYQLLTLSIERWFCCNNKKIVFLWFISLCKAVAWECWMHFPDSQVFLSISVFADWFLYNILYVLLSREWGRGWQWNGSGRPR